MRIVYDSRTGLGRKFAEKLSFQTQPVSEPVCEPCILVTRNEGLGRIPKPTLVFLQQYDALIKGVVVNGNKRFGKFYCAAGPKIESRYRIPIIRNIEGEGTDEDVRFVAHVLKKLHAEGRM